MDEGFRKMRNKMEEVAPELQELQKKEAELSGARRQRLGL